MNTLYINNYRLDVPMRMHSRERLEATHMEMDTITIPICLDADNRPIDIRFFNIFALVARARSIATGKAASISSSTRGK